MIVQNDINKAKKIVILLHGRGGSAEDILSLTFSLPNKDVSYIALTADDNQWYPYPFTYNRQDLEPFLSNSLKKVDELVTYALQFQKPSNIYLAGFSQGACLALQYISNSKHKLGGVFAFSGGLIGSDEELNVFSTSNNIFIGCSTNDPFIKLDRVNKTIDLFKGKGNFVKTHIYEGSSHHISIEEINELKEILLS